MELVRHSSVISKLTCVQCLIDGHVRHFIKPVDTTKYEKLVPYWGKIDLEFEGVKENTRHRNVQLEYLTAKFLREKSWDLTIREFCQKWGSFFFNLGSWNLMTSTSVAGRNYWGEKVVAWEQRSPREIFTLRGLWF